jgi:hypothetical protein
MSDYDRRIRSERASRQLYRLAVAPELWRCHDLMDRADRISRGLPPRGEDVQWRRGDMTAKIAGLGARMAAAWRELTHRVAREAPVR